MMKFWILPVLSEKRTKAYLMNKERKIFFELAPFSRAPLHSRYRSGHITAYIWLSLCRASTHTILITKQVLANGRRLRLCHPISCSLKLTTHRLTQVIRHYSKFYAKISHNDRITCGRCPTYFSENFLRKKS